MRYILIIWWDSQIMRENIVPQSTLCSPQILQHLMTFNYSFHFSFNYLVRTWHFWICHPSGWRRWDDSTQSALLVFCQTVCLRIDVADACYVSAATSTNVSLNSLSLIADNILWLGEFPVGSIFSQLSYTISLCRRKYYSLLKTSYRVMINYMPVDKCYISASISTNALFR